MTYKIHIPEALFPAVYTPAKPYGRDTRPSFQITFQHNLLPPDLALIIPGFSRDERPDRVTARSGYAPLVVEARERPERLRQVIQQAEDANMPRDFLLQGIPMEVSLDTYETDTSECGRRMNLGLRAIRVDADDMARVFIARIRSAFGE